MCSNSISYKCKCIQKSCLLSVMLNHWLTDLLLQLAFHRTAGPSSPPSSPGGQTSPSRTTGTARSRSGSPARRGAAASGTAAPAARRPTTPRARTSRWSSTTRRASAPRRWSSQGRLLCMARWAGAKGPSLKGAHNFLLNSTGQISTTKKSYTSNHAHATLGWSLGDRSPDLIQLFRRRTADAWVITDLQALDRSPEIAAADWRRHAGDERPTRRRPAAPASKAAPLRLLFLVRTYKYSANTSNSIEVRTCFLWFL